MTLPALARGLALAALVALSGCLGSGNGSGPDAAVPGNLEGLSEATFGLGQFMSLSVPMRDGVQLHLDVQLPAGEGPFPTILEYTPYTLLGGEDWGLLNDLGLAQTVPVAAGPDFWVTRGYAYGIAHVRGTGESGGCLTIGDPVEGRDGYDLVEWVANQTWSSGRIAMMGTSYVGTTPIETAVLQPPHLTTIVPISAVTDWYRYYFENGEQRVNGDQPPGASYPDPLLWAAIGATPGVRTGAADPEDVPCVAEFTQQYWLQDDRNPYWTLRNHGAGAGNITIPVLYVQGFLDENVATSMVPEFWPHLTSERRAWFAQHAHGVDAEHPEISAYIHRWLDHHLLGRDNGAMLLPPVQVEDNLRQYRDEAAWPPADAAPVRFHLAPGELVAGVPADATASWTDMGPYCSRQLGAFGVSAEGTTGQAPPCAEVQATSLELRSEVLATALHLAGSPTVHLEASADGTDAQLNALLEDEAPDGSRSFVTRGYLDARHADDLAHGQDLVPGQVRSFTWEMHPRDHRVEAGHRLVLTLSSFDPYVIPDQPGTTVTVRFGAEGSWLDVPAIQRDAAAFRNESAAPWDAGAQAEPTLHQG